MAGGRLPGAICQLRTPQVVSDGTSCRSASPYAGPLALNSGVATWSYSEKLVEAARRAIPFLPAEMRDEFAALFTPESIGLTTALLVAWGVAHFYGVGEAADLIMLGILIASLGWQAFRVMGDLIDFVSTALGAETEADLDEAGMHLAKAVSVIGVTAFVALLTKGVAKSVRLLRGKLPGRTGAWWEASEFGPNHPGTQIAQNFTLKVGNRVFKIKPNATKHMAERAIGRPNLGAYAGQVEYPISSLAGALEQAQNSGRLAPLLNGTVTRLGTQAAPFVVGDWELSLELVNGVIEVFHAVPKG